MCFVSSKLISSTVCFPAEVSLSETHVDLRFKRFYGLYYKQVTGGVSATISPFCPIFSLQYYCPFFFFIGIPPSNTKYGMFRVTNLNQGQ